MERMFLISSTNLQEIMRYLMSRPYAEVVKLMTILSTLEAQGESKNDKQKDIKRS